MGAYFASQFFAADGFNTVLLASGSRQQKLREQGLVVNHRAYPLDVLDPAAADSKMDLVIVALKHQHLSEALSHLGNLVADHTIFLSVMNGLESESIIASAFGSEKVLYAVSVAIDAQRADNKVSYSNPGIHYFGHPSNEQPSAKVLLVQRAFDRAGIRYQTPVDMLRMMWWKFMLNVGVNQSSTIMGAPYGVYQQSHAASATANAFSESLMREVIALAQMQQVNLGDADIADWYPVLETLAPTGKTSMLQDVEAGRKTEVEIFAGSVVRMGDELGVPTPVNRAALQIIQVLEANYNH